MASCDVFPNEDQLPVSEYKPPIFMVVICGLSSFLQDEKNKTDSTRNKEVRCFIVVYFVCENNKKMSCELCGYQLQLAKRPFLLSLQVSPFIYYFGV